MTIKMKDVVEIHRKIRAMNPIEAFMEGESIVNDADRIGEYINEVSDKAQELMLEKLDETFVVDAVNSLAATIAVGMAMQVGKTAPIEFIANEDADFFIHTLILAVIGMLIDEEVL